MDWNGSVIKPPAFENEGALHIGKGRFLLSISGDKGEKTVSTKKKWLAAVIAVTAVIVAILVSTLLIGHQANQMPYKTELSLLLGSSFGTVTEQLELEQTDWEQLDETAYKLRKPCELSGVPFELKIMFDKNGKLCGYSYVAAYSADGKRAAADIYKIAIDLNVNAYKTEETVVQDLRYDTLKKQFSEGNPLALVVTNANAYENVVDDPVAMYLEDLEASPDWPGRIGEYVVKQAVCYYTISMEYAPETETVFIHITNTVEQEREK